MRRLLCLGAVALAAAAGGTARADTFVVVPPAAAALPSAETPNVPGSLLLPPNVFVSPFATPRELAAEELHALWERAGAAYGIPWQVLGAINKVETNFGRNMGPSSAGAVGWMQFMPDTWLRWGLDASGDGVADPWNPEDAVYAAARYLAAAGGREDLRRGVFAYNHADWYVEEVLELAALYGGGGSTAVFEFDRLASAVDEAEAAVLAASDTLRAAEAREAELRATAEAAFAHASDHELLSDRLEADRAAYALELDRAAAEAEVERLRAALADAEATLADVRSGAHTASFAPGAAALLGTAFAGAGYVFPVGGGPATVSVSPDHHDYPAADIAAPEGAPVYALADAVVVDRIDDSRCGLGFALRTADGLEWVYCHLSYVSPAVAAGASVAGGAWLGLVGSTGRSTGPHLHLQLSPADAYPQEQAWFRAFAGSAFRWQGEAPPLPTGPIFAVVPSPPASPVVEFTLERS